MVRMAIRGLFARKLRTALTGFAVVIGVAFVSGTFIFTDTINASFTDLFERVAKGVDANVTAKQPVEGDFGGRIQPLPPGTLEKVEAADGVEAAEPRFETVVSIFNDKRERIGGNGPPSIVFSSNEERFDPLTYIDGGPAEQPGQVTLDEATADREGYEVGDKLLIGGRAPVKSYEISGITNVGDQKSIGIQSMNMPLSEVQRIAAGAGRGHRGRGSRRGRHEPRGAQGFDRRLARRLRRRADGQGAGGGVRLRHHRLARLPQDRPAGLRRRRRARRRLPDLQHVRRDRRAALARVRAAAHARRVAPPGAQLSDRRDAGDRLPRLGGRDPRGRGARAGAALAAGVVRDRAAIHGHGDRAPHGDRRPGGRHGRHAGLGPGPGAPRDPGRAGRGDARRRHARRPPGQPQAAARLVRGHRPRAGVAAGRPLRRRGRVRRGRAARARHDRDDLRRRAARPGARAAAGALHRRSAGALPGHARPPGARERRAPAAAHRDHRVGADDRPGARRLHGDLRRRPARVDRQGDRRAAQPLGADRDPRRRLLARPARRGDGARQDPGRDGRVADALRPGQRQGRRRRSAGVRRRPGDGYAAVPAGDRARRPAGARRAARRPGVRLGLVGEGPRLRASATSSRSRRRRASTSTTSWPERTTTRSACSASSS